MEKLIYPEVFAQKKANEADKWQTTLALILPGQWDWPAQFFQKVIAKPLNRLQELPEGNRMEGEKLELSQNP